MKNRILLSAIAVLAMAAPLASGPAQAVDGDQPPFKLTMPPEVTATSYDGQVYLETGPRLTTGSEPFELRATRASYSEPIVVRWMRSGGAVTLPSGAMTDFHGLPNFFRTAIRGPKGHLFSASWTPLCPSGETGRARPDAPAHNPYPSGCPYHPFTLGSVIGMQSGWYTEFGDGFYGADGSPLKPGTYKMVTTIHEKYREMFEVSLADARKETVLKVVQGSADGFRQREAAADPTPAPLPQPARSRPTGRASTPVAGPRPDLRSLPAFGMQVGSKGNYLQFEATVWNGGTSPMVVDGFRREGQDLMDAHQYFFDTDGNQTGYQNVGTMEWDPRPSHQHWHFTDFARYRLLNADKTLARRSQKEAFCLANTDAVDYTLPAADWHPEGTDLGTACGDYGSQSVRESLAAGSGDTYGQFRAGQSFDLRGLPNGVYFISVEANPEHKLIETSTTNNDSLRRVRIGGRSGHRTVTYGPVGIVDDSGAGGYSFRTH